MEININELENKVLHVVDNKINDVFYEFQTELGITNGDITPDQLCYLEEMQEKISKIICEVLLFELGLLFDDEED